MTVKCFQVNLSAFRRVTINFATIMLVVATLYPSVSFAQNSNTDTIAPTAPSNVSASDFGTGGAIILTWNNPTDSDFKSVTIYRSTSGGDLGAKVYSNVSSTSKKDSGLTSGIKYYYTVRSVDSTGNESANVLQTSAVPTKSLLPKTGSNARPATTLTYLSTAVLIFLIYRGLAGAMK